MRFLEIFRAKMLLGIAGCLVSAQLAVGQVQGGYGVVPCLPVACPTGKCEKNYTHYRT